MTREEGSRGTDAPGVVNCEPFIRGGGTANVEAVGGLTPEHVDVVQGALGLSRRSSDRVFGEAQFRRRPSALGAKACQSSLACGSRRLAEGVGFEPTVPCGTTVFKTAAIGHSATPPRREQVRRLPTVFRVMPRAAGHTRPRLPPAAAARGKTAAIGHSATPPAVPPAAHAPCLEWSNAPRRESRVISADRFSLPPPRHTSIISLR